VEDPEEDEILKLCRRMDANQHQIMSHLGMDDTGP